MALAALIASLLAAGSIDWAPEDARGRARYRIGELTLTLRAEPDEHGPDLIRPFLTVERPGEPPVELEGSTVPPSFEHRVSVGSWDGEASYVLFQSFTGGAHCCNFVQIVYPDGGRLRAAELGEWDADYLDEVPRDIDGDGRIDFVFADDRFLYAFASYSESHSVPRILNLADGEVRDVSDRAAFAHLFEQGFSDARQHCLFPDGISAKGACAAYAAAAARLGRFDAAWAEIAAIDPASLTACGPEQDDWNCPWEDSEGAAYPEALRAFLAEAGYIPD